MRHIAIGKIVFFAVVAFASLQASADWAVTARVTLVDASGMGARPGDSIAPILFKIDQAISGNPCVASGTTASLVFFPYNFLDGTGDTAHPAGNDRQMVNSKANLSTLQLALATGLRVNILGFPGSSGFCQVYGIQIISN